MVTRWRSAACLTALLLAPSGIAQTDELYPTWTTIVPRPLGPGAVELELTAELDDGSFIVVGREWWTAVLVHYGPDGQLLSLAKVRDYYDWSATIDPAGAVVISGYSSHPFGDYSVMRYDAVTGRPRWRSAAALEGRRRELDRLQPHAIDPSGNVLALQLDCEEPTKARCSSGAWSVVKLSGADGRALWGPVVEVGRSLRARLLTVAQDNDVVVALPKAAEHFRQRLTPGLTLDLAGGWLPPAQTGVPYAFELPARNGQPPLRFRLTSGALPRGFKLDRRSGTIAGTSTEEGAWHFDVEVTDRQRLTIRRSLSLDVFSEAAVLRGAPSPTARVIPFELYSPLRCSDVPSSVP